MIFGLSDPRDRMVWQLYRMRERIWLDPPYQRLGNIWSPENRQLLVDTVLNKFDMPKIYLHKFPRPIRKRKKTYDFAIVDGKQRLETLWAFMDGGFALADDFELIRDSNVKAGGMTYQELGQQYPDLKAEFDGFPLSIVAIETDDIDMIEEMFSRLNEAAPLTGAEMRNAYGGPLPIVIRKLAREQFFVKKLPFENKRYRHYDLATKFLLAEHAKSIVDTKKTRLDDFVDSYATQPRNKIPAFAKDTHDNLVRMCAVFSDKDVLLRQVGMVMLYYYLFHAAHAGEWTSEITRKKLVDFDNLRAKNRERMEKGEKNVDLDLIEFDSYAQSPNDAAALKFRMQKLLKTVFKRDPGGETQ